MKDPNWFYSLEIDKLFAKHLNHFIDKPVTFLQIGAFTGNASKWLVENILTHPKSKLIDVDAWTFLPLIAGFESKKIEEKYDLQMQEHIKTGKVVKIHSYSSDFFNTNTDTFDFIYVDGGHATEEAVEDGNNAIMALVPNGIISFDDYNMNDIVESFKQKRKVCSVKDAIKTLDFTNFSILEDEECYQFWVQKNDHINHIHNNF
jgi:hypothetical protein